MTCKKNLAVSILNRAGFEGNPAQTASGTSAGTPTQLGFLELFSTCAVFFGDGLNGLGVKAQALFTGAICLGGDIESGHEPLFSFQHF